ncbi:MAG TPA: hypothetical protein VF559_05320 [Caulobacteraceae bacterium]|jgi:hypothetical protein
MLVRTLLPLLLLPALPLAACDRRESIVRAESPLEAASPAQAQGQPAFVGAWARTAAECAQRPWRLSSTHLAGPGGVDCSIDQLDASLAGYTAHSACTRGGVATPGRIVLTLGPAGGRTLTLSEGPFREPVSLVRCAAGGGT